uniref:CENP-T/Histone H4 histone fold domain-containing protein n=1 Tax=Salvator merianae TaxID=96440 RepID=A0A8D0DNP1_SALMN
MELQENSNTEPLLSTGKHLATDMTPVRSSTPTHSEHPEVPPGHLPAVLYEKFTRHSLKESVSSTIQELNRSIPAVLSSSETNVEEDPFTNENIVQVTQRSAESPSRRSGRKNSVQLEGPRTEEMVEGATQQTGDECRTREMMDVQAENDVISEAEMHFEDEETSEAETDHRNIDPAGSTPAFVHARAFPGTPLLPGARAPKVAASISLSKQSSQKQISKPPEKVHRRKHEPALPRSFIKKIFGHYVRMPVAKDAFNAVERCVNLYFKHLSDDLEAYANHARRKTVEPADLELLMRRQDLVTEKMPLNVLIEHHLPLEYRKLLIPVATSGNKVTPSKPL